MKKLTYEAQWIIEVIEITEQEYCEMVEAGGLEWLNHNYADYQLLIDLYRHNKWFWKWWINQWEIRDRKCPLLPKYPPIGRKIYREHHNVRHLTITPNIIVVQEINKAIRALQK